MFLRVHIFTFLKLCWQDSYIHGNKHRKTRKKMGIMQSKHFKSQTKTLMHHQCKLWTGLLVYYLPTNIKGHCGERCLPANNHNDWPTLAAKADGFITPLLILTWPEKPLQNQHKKSTFCRCIHDKNFTVPDMSWWCDEHKYSW